MLANKFEIEDYQVDQGMGVALHHDLFILDIGLFSTQGKYNVKIALGHSIRTPQKLTLFRGHPQLLHLSSQYL